MLAPNSLTSSRSSKDVAAAAFCPWFKDRHLFQVTFLAALAVYGYAVANFSLHMDVEAAVAYGSINYTFSLGRWGISLVHMLILPEPVVPYFTAVLTLLFLTSAALASQSVFLFSPAQRYAFTILYVSFPEFAYQLEFLNQSDCVAFGLFCGTLSFLALQNHLKASSTIKRVAWISASITLMTLGAAFYEAIVFVIPTLCTLLVLQRALIDPPRLALIFRSYIWAAVVTIGSYGLCASLGRVFERAFAVPPSGYLANMIGWHIYPLDQAITRAVSFMIRDVLGNDYYGNVLYRGALASGIVITFSSILRRFTVIRVILVIALIASALFVPFVIVIVLGEHQEPRTFVTEQVVFAAMIVIAFSMVDLRTEVQAALVALVVLVSAFHVSRLFYSDMVAWTSDKSIGNRIIQQIYHVDPTFEERVTPVYFHGAYTEPNLWRNQNYNTFGNSFLMWDGGATYRISGFLHDAALANFQLPTADEVRNVEPALQALPTWPNPNSVRLIAGVMVVRLGP